MPFVTSQQASFHNSAVFSRRAEEFVLLKAITIRKHYQGESCVMWDLEITAERTSEPVLKPGGGLTSADVRARAVASLKMKGSCSCP